LKYQLIAIDLDGTVLNKEGVIIPSAKEAIQRVLAKGVEVTLATGRMYQPSNRFAEELGISLPLICYQGAMIREPGNGEILWHKPLSLPMARKVITETRQLGVHQYVYIDDEMYVEEIGEKDLLYAQLNYVELNLVNDLTVLLKKRPTGIAARGEPAEIDRLMSRFNVYFGSRVIVNKVHASFCEIAHPKSGKDNALEYLANLLGIPQQQTVAIGDGPNDISMLKWAGLGIVIGNAPDEVRQAADCVVDIGTQDSFAEAITQLLCHGENRGVLKTSQNKKRNFVTDLS
jgi:Cof subfamily protein (haloacid dehalogenase superfamily)